MPMAVTEIRVCGAVQGVGFRPAVYAVARAMDITGTVENSRDGVLIRIDADPDRGRLLLDGLAGRLPAAARIDSVTFSLVPGHTGRKDFVILSSSGEGEIPTDVVPDIAICSACLDDMRRPGHRHNYPLVNCTCCGPRFSIIRALPYDRPNTTMKDFEMCPECRREYDDPLDRRHHAQPVACNECGPEMILTLPDGTVIAAYDDIVRTARTYLSAGGLIVCKGIGGYNLIADATSADALAKLREMKHRPRKPLAVMVADVGEARTVAVVTPPEAEALASWRAPVVVLPAIAGALPGGVAPGCSTVGVMLPYTAVHHSLCSDGMKLAVTSANLSGEPIITDDVKAADYARSHGLPCISFNREIANRLDDSVVRLIAGKIRLLRRSRGYVPEPLHTSLSCDGIIGAGADVTSQWALGRGDDIIQSPYIGSLSDAGCCMAYEASVETMSAIYGVRPRTVVVDMHPAYRSRQLAAAMAAEYGAGVIGMQHHHAHAVSVMADCGIDGEVLALVLDGTGYGPDGTIWGAELLRCDMVGYKRIAHGDLLPMPGGDKAALEPWRMAVSWVWSVTRSLDLLPRQLVETVGVETVAVIGRMLEKRINSPLSAGAGRLFDAVAALLGLAYTNGYEAEAPVLLEGAAAAAGDQPAYRINVIRPLDLSPLLRAILADLEAGVPVPVIAARFHSTYAEVWYRVILEASMRSRLKRVVLSGGVMQNALLVRYLVGLLENAGLQVYLPQNVCLGDACIAVGQVAHAAALRNQKPEKDA